MSSFTYMTLQGFYRDNKSLMELIFNDIERDVAAAYFARGVPPHDHSLATKLEEIAEKFKKPLGAAKSSLITAKAKVEQRYRLRQDLNLFEKDMDSIGYLPISRTEVLRTLFKLGYQRIEQLRTTTDAELLKIDGVGPVVLREIRHAITVHDEVIAPRPEPAPQPKARKPRLTRPLLRDGRSRTEKAEKAGQMVLVTEG